MNRGERLRLAKKFREKRPASAKCRRAKCGVCHPGKVSKAPTRQEMRANCKFK